MNEWKKLTNLKKCNERFTNSLATIQKKKVNCNCVISILSLLSKCLTFSPNAPIIRLQLNKLLWHLTESSSKRANNGKSRHFPIVRYNTRYCKSETIVLKFHWKISDEPTAFALTYLLRKIFSDSLCVVCGLCFFYFKEQNQEMYRNTERELDVSWYNLNSEFFLTLLRKT